MDWPILMKRMLEDKHVTFLVHEGGDTFMVIDEACWLNSEEAEDVRGLLDEAGAKRSDVSNRQPDDEGAQRS